MSSIGNDLPVPSSNHFQHYSESLFSPSNVDQHLQQQLQFQSQQNHLLLHQQSSSIDPRFGSNASPIPSYFSENLANTFTQSTPEKSSVSQSPPSPADSGVVTDSKSDGGNVSQESLQNLDHSKLDDSLEFLGSMKNAGSSMAFSACLPIDQESNLCISKDSTVQNLNSTKVVSDLSSTPNNDVEISVKMPPNLASIWSTPIANNQDLPNTNADMEEAVLEALQQQQLGNWSGNMSAPPPGLASNALMQKQFQQSATAAQIQAMHLALRRSQSNIISQANLLNRSTSYQAGNFFVSPIKSHSQPFLLIYLKAEAYDVQSSTFDYV